MLYYYQVAGRLQDYREYIGKIAITARIQPRYIENYTRTFVIESSPPVPVSSRSSLSSTDVMRIDKIYAYLCLRIIIIYVILLCECEYAIKRFSLEAGRRFLLIFIFSILIIIIIIIIYLLIPRHPIMVITRHYIVCAYASSYLYIIFTRTIGPVAAAEEDTYILAYV